MSKFKQGECSEWLWPTCRCGRMICALGALLVLGIGWLSRHMARTTLLVRRTLSGKYDGSPTTWQTDTSHCASVDCMSRSHDKWLCELTGPQRNAHSSKLMYKCCLVNMTLGSFGALFDRPDSVISAPIFCRGSNAQTVNTNELCNISKVPDAVLAISQSM